MALDAIIHRKRFSWWQEFRKAPCPTLAKVLYAQRQQPFATTHRSGSADITIICISDTHNSQPAIPQGDILIHAGDLTQAGTAAELQRQLDWLNAQPHPHKCVIAGNHDVVLDATKSAQHGIPHSEREALRWSAITYLQKSSAILEIPSTRSLTIYGHPSTPQHGNWAFQHDRHTDVFTDVVSDHVNILITHAPPQFHLDVAGWGDEHLLRELWRVKPKLHVFGHVHEGHGMEVLRYDELQLLYERVCLGSAGVLALLRMTLLLFSTWCVGPDIHAKETILVNAAAVGGIQDRIQRRAIVVRL